MIAECVGASNAGVPASIVRGLNPTAGRTSEERTSPRQAQLSAHAQNRTNAIMDFSTRLMLFSPFRPSGTLLPRIRLNRMTTLSLHIYYQVSTSNANNFRPFCEKIKIYGKISILDDFSLAMNLFYWY
jgi:hypothetical protein